MDNPLQSALQRMGSNFLVAAFVPAMAFIIVCAVVFHPVFPLGSVQYFGGDLAQFIQINFVILLFVIVLGFTLFSLRTYIYKSFEGYTFILQKNTILGRSFSKRQEKRFKKIEEEIAWIEKELTRVNRKIEQESYNTKIGKRQAKRLDRYANEQKALQSRRYDLVSEKNENFPPSFDLLLPTRFGNLLRAAEMYPGTHYGIDAVPLWGRLSHVIPDDGMDKIDEADNQCLFLLNGTLLTATFAILCVFASIYQGFTWQAAINKTQIFHSIEINSEPAVYQERMWLYIVLALLSVVVAWFFYEASLLNVSQFGGMIRASYDLYRFNLLEGLHLDLPDSLRSERQIWRRLSYFMAGNYQGKELEDLEFLENLSEFTEIDIHYTHSQKHETQS